MVRLCSNSETRAKLLESFGVEFIQSGVDFNEDNIKLTTPKSFVYSVVKGKLDSALKKFDLEIPLLVADTVIATKNGKILRKAKSKSDAKEILLEQSGSEISIITASILKSKKLEFIDISATHYLFKIFDEEDLQNYLNRNEWQGKAGACMVEGFCQKYINRVLGLESTAMGLPVEKIIPWIEFDVFW